MRACIQRVSRAQVIVDGQSVGRIQHGMLVLLGVGRLDTEKEGRWLAEKIIGLRIFDDDDGKMNRSLLDVGGGLLVVSQFTLWGDCRKGKRPSFIQAAEPHQAEELYEKFVVAARELGAHVETGRFRAHMDVELVNDGPVTLNLEKSASN